MAENNISPNVDTVGKLNPTDPVKTSDIAERSDKRMGMLAKNLIAHTPGVVEPAKSEPEKVATNPKSEPQNKDTKPNDGKEQITRENAPEPTDVKLEDGKSTEKKEEPSKGEKPPIPAKKLTLTETEAERVKWQQRATKSETEAKKALEERTIWEKEKADLTEKAKLVDDFTKDPIAFINSRMPEIGQKLAVAGDPIKMLESEVGIYVTELEKKFKQEFGEDWKYSEAESLRPGSPSFRYKIAIQSRTNEAQQRVADYVKKQQIREQDAQVQILKDKEGLKTEFELTDEDFKNAEEFFQKTPASYKNLVKLALFDVILKKKLSQIVPPEVPSRDITQTRGGIAEEKGEETKEGKLSKEGAKMASRLPIRQTI